VKIVVGLINFFFGIIEILGGVTYILFTIPKLLKVYENLNVEPYNPGTAYLYPALLVLLGLVNVLIGLGNFSVIFKNKSDLVYKIGIFLVTLSFIVTKPIVSNMVNSVVNPIYRLSNFISN
jgi:hypothetical protein